ncbi:transposase family protein [Streptomyces sp. NPDC021354]|uniref:helix-turn-helix domain-containing protein n=1 Tax=Streptomyces sp. NPDC021354 TaxID=3154793 RepID=UPI0033E12BB5
MGAGAKHRLVFVDRLLATLVHLCQAVTHDVLACWLYVDRSTITRAIGEVRRLLAERGRSISPDVRLRTLAEVVDHLGATGKTGIIDGTEVRVRRPGGRTETIHLRQDQAGCRQGNGAHRRRRSWVLFCSPSRLGSFEDITQARQLGLVKFLAEGSAVQILADAGYHRALAPRPVDA